MGKQSINPVQAQAFSDAVLKILRTLDDVAVIGIRVRDTAIGLRLIKEKKDGGKTNE